MPPADPTMTITIRTASDADTGTLRRLAALDETGSLALPALIAEQDGHVVAALSLRDGAVAADPFAHTVETIELLRVRSQRLTRRPRGLPIPRRGRAQRPASASA